MDHPAPLLEASATDDYLVYARTGDGAALEWKLPLGMAGSLRTKRDEVTNEPWDCRLQCC